MKTKDKKLSQKFDEFKENLIRIFGSIFEYLSGDFAYKKYLEHQVQNHSNKDILTRKEFLRQKMKNKNFNRCC